MTREQQTLKIALTQIKELLHDFSQIYGALIRSVYQLGEESSHVGEDFKKTADQVYTLEEGGYVYTYIKNFSRLLEEMTGFFQHSYEVDCSYVEAVNNELEILTKLESMVKLMNETAIDMEIISINTLTVAVRAGKVGGAFSYITNEIKKLTQAMGSQAEILKNRTYLVNNSLSTSKENFAVILKQEKDINDLLITKLPDSLASELEKTKTLYARYIVLHKEFTKVNTHVNSLMEYLQFQDTIAQSLENMSNVLNRYIIQNVEQADDNKEKYLDFLLLKERLYKTSQSIMDDLKHRCKENLDSFRSSARDMQTFIRSVSKNKIEVDQALLNQGFFREVIERVKTYASLLETSHQLKNDFAKSASPLLKGINGLRQVFEAIALIITRFENINIASKIEVAKQKDLMGMDGNIREMTQLINVISRDLGGGGELVARFVSSIEKTFSNYALDLLKGEKTYKAFQSEVHTFLNHLVLHFERVECVLGSYSLSTSFMEAYYQTVTDALEDSKDLFKRVDDLSEAISYLYLEARAELERALQEYRLSTWEFSSSDYTETINHFKIYSYKMAMKENLGKKVMEDAVEEGEVILF